MDKRIKILIAILFVVSILLFFYLFNKKETASVPVDKGVVVPIKRLVDTSNWNKYYNSQLGFSIKIPKEVFEIVSCRQEKGLTPIRVLQDNNKGIVYIFEDYYKNNQSGQCVKVSRSLDDLRVETENTGKDIVGGLPMPYFGWEIIINEAKNDEDVLEHIKDNFGSGCIVTYKRLQEDGNYDIKLSGSQKVEEGDPWWGNCYLNFAYKIIYSSEKNKLMSMGLGQECKFYSSDPGTSSSYQCYDEAMIQSFKFE
jgi:hypothetical protein